MGLLPLNKTSIRFVLVNSLSIQFIISVCNIMTNAVCSLMLSDISDSIDAVWCTQCITRLIIVRIYSAKIRSTFLIWQYNQPNRFGLMVWIFFWLKNIISKSIIRTNFFDILSAADLPKAPPYDSQVISYDSIKFPLSKVWWPESGHDKLPFKSANELVHHVCMTVCAVKFGGDGAKTMRFLLHALFDWIFFLNFYEFRYCGGALCARVHFDLLNHPLESPMIYGLP